MGTAKMAAARMAAQERPSNPRISSGDLLTDCKHNHVVEEVGRRWYRGPRRYYRPYRYR